MGRMDGEGLVHDEKKRGVTPFPKKRREKRGQIEKRESFEKILESRAIFTREIERSCAIFKGIGRIVYRRGKWNL